MGLNKILKNLGGKKMTFKRVKSPKKFVEDYVGEKLKWGLKNKFGINFIYGIDR